MTTLTYRVRAAFRNQGEGWKWLTWTCEGDGNKHAAIINKAQEIGAVAWDFGQADYVRADRANF